MRPKSVRSTALEEFLGKSRTNLDGVVHLNIDVQRKFCDPSYLNAPLGTQKTKKTAEYIANFLLPSLNSSIKNFFIYCTNPEQDKYLPSAHYGGFYLVEPKAEDISVPKSTPSAFKGSYIEAELKTHKATHLIFSGFNTSWCVKETVIDALKKKFNVCVLRDAVENGRKSAFKEDVPTNYLNPKKAFKEMEQKGALMIQSAELIKYVETITPPELV